MVAEHDSGRFDSARTGHRPVVEDDVLVSGQPPPLLRLPVVYAVAVALRDAGLSLADIAARIGAPEESMGSLLLLADAKLASLGT